MQNTIIQTDRLNLREFCKDDLHKLYKILSNANVMQYSSTGIMTKEDTRKLIERNINSYQQGHTGIWAVTDKENDKLIGMGGCYFQEIEGPRELEIVYKLKSSYWGKGLGTELAASLVEYALSKLGVNRVVAAIDINNQPSMRVAEKIGMHLERSSVYLEKPIYLYAIEKPKFT